MISLPKLRARHRAEERRCAGISAAFARLLAGYAETLGRRRRWWTIRFCGCGTCEELYGDDRQLLLETDADRQSAYRLMVRNTNAAQRAAGDQA